MDKKKIEQKVKEILADKLDTDIKKIKTDSNLVDDLGMDSFVAIELGFELEEKFGLKILEEDIVKMKIVKDIINFIDSKIE